MKSIAVSSGISALLGITEPAMFGVNLKMKYPFYAAMFGSAVGCAYVTLTNVQNISPGAAGIIGFVCIKSGGMLNYMIGILISLVVGFAVTLGTGKTDFSPSLLALRIVGLGCIWTLFYSRNPLISLIRDKIILQLQLRMPGSVSMTLCRKSSISSLDEATACT